MLKSKLTEAVTKLSLIDFSESGLCITESGTNTTELLFVKSQLWPNKLFWWNRVLFSTWLLRTKSRCTIFEDRSEPSKVPAAFLVALLDFEVAIFLIQLKNVTT